MPWVRFVLGSWHRVLHLRQMHAAVGKESTAEKAIFDVLSIPGTSLKKNPTHGARHGPSVRQTMYHKAHDMLRKARKHTKWWLQKHSGQMEERWQVSQVFVRCWMDWGTDQSIWWNRTGRPFLRGYMARKKSERKILENLFECRRTKESSQWL